eukprot:8491612-Alexandrium_andersonii.AAC.1
MKRSPLFYSLVLAEVQATAKAHQLRPVTPINTDKHVCDGSGVRAEAIKHNGTRCPALKRK